ncbi:dolichyl-phosphate-mannose-protein mannosyltransferase [Synechococcus sp. PCC 7335]|uniref:glycosyltransferase family 39 protein n=1 Tax=Synechococcus sp. (strain ATCC 29403 / PCC 7335) TaxID=91464 RepID=UPI00017EB7E5|nr:glycosyltransferase family 39 protein [Synechococcus sp. PCC 7335]EDX85889.1 dolichyl-phosphate-mannose-protein mannosyltransferase [Synechococcus sp. PCC 7335]
MKNRLGVARLSQPQLWNGIIVILIGLGVLFRVTNLDRPVYWVDEVATSMRVSGYTQAEVVEQVATEQPLSVSDLQRFQVIRPVEDSSAEHPLLGLIGVLVQSPEHAPLYFVLARFWAELFGNSVVAMRSLPVLFGLLGIPAMYGTGRSLFSQMKDAQAQIVAKTAAGLLAISPFFVAYSQEARPYSLWILLLLLTTQCLWRSLQTGRWRWWIAYGTCLILSLYTSLLTILVVLGQGLAVLLWYRRRLYAYLTASAIALSALSPWVIVVLTHWPKLQSNTVWMQQYAPIWATLGTWFYSLAVLFFDVPVAERPLVFGVQVVVATATLTLIGYASYVFVRRTSPQLWGLVLATALSTPSLLLLVDLLRSGQAAATPRYLMPTHLVVLLVVAYLLCDHLFKFPSPTKLWRLIAASLLTVSLVSCLIPQPSPYLKSRNLSNADLTALLNTVRSPHLVTTPSSIQDLISLSYDLDPDIVFYVLPSDTASANDLLTGILSEGKATFLLAPSTQVRQRVEDSQRLKLTKLYQPPPLISGGFALTLWQVKLL